MSLSYWCVSALCLLPVSFAIAQTAPPSDPPTAAAQDQQNGDERPWSAGPINFSGLVDGYYSLNFQHPSTRNNVLRNFDVRANEFSLNMAKLELSVDPSPIGARLDIGFGRRLGRFPCDRTARPGSRHHAPDPTSIYQRQAFQLGWIPVRFRKVLHKCRSRVDGNTFGFNYSRAFMYANGPYYHFGARMSKPVAGPWTVGVQVVNGWNNVEDNNSGKTIGITSALAGRKVSLFNTYYVGPEKAGTNDGYRHFFDTVLNINPTNKISTYINYDIGVDKDSPLNGGNKNWYALGLAGRFQVSTAWALAARYEIYNDIDGLITTKAQKLQEFTGTLEFKIAQGFLTRLEYRRDHSNIPFFDRGNEPGSGNNQTTLLLGFVAFFGPKR